MEYTSVETSESPRKDGAIRSTSRQASRGYLEIFRDYVDRETLLIEIEEAFLDGIELLAGRESRERCSRDGLEAMHLHFPYQHLGMLEPFVLSRLKRRLLTWAAKVGLEDLELTGEFFVQDLLLLRINYPHASKQHASADAKRPSLEHRLRYGLRNVAASIKAAIDSGTMIGRPREMLAYYRNRGKVEGVAYRGHPSHLDSWFGQPVGSLSVWLAIAGLDTANSMCLYPETDGLRIPQNGSLYLGSGFLLPKPTRPELADGDLLVFTTDMLHCTQLNVTDKTRIALSIRVSAQTPTYDEKNLWFIEEWHSSNDLLRGKIRRPSSCGSRRVPVREASEAPWRQTTTVAVAARFKTGLKQPIMASEVLPDGGKVAARFEDREIIVFRTSGQLTAFDGICPHGTYRLADGHHGEGVLTCPGHGLEFNVRTGEARLSCFDLRRLEVFEENGTIFLA